MKKIAIFASGDGSNAEAIVEKFANNDNIEVAVVLSNRIGAKVHDRMSLTGISGYAPLLEVTVDSNGKFVKGKIHSFRQAKGCAPKLDSTNAAAKEIRTLSKEDFPQPCPQISDNGEISLRK